MMFSELNGQPGCTPVNASLEQLPIQTHHSGPKLMANLYFVRLFHSLLSCGFCRRSVLVLSETVLSATVLVLDGCLNCGAADRRSRRFAGTCAPIGRIATLGHFEYEYEYEYREAEYEYEKKHEQSIGPKCSIGRF
jgi:hypothetical protein